MNAFYEMYDLANEFGFNRLLDSLVNENYFPYKVIAKSNDSKISIEVELPRIKKEDIKVSIVNNTLSIVVKDNNKEYSKSGKINSKYDTDNIKLKLEYGVLYIELDEKTVNKISSEKVLMIE